MISGALGKKRSGFEMARESLARTRPPVEVVVVVVVVVGAPPTGAGAMADIVAGSGEFAAVEPAVEVAPAAGKTVGTRMTADGAAAAGASPLRARGPAVRAPDVPLPPPPPPRIRPPSTRRTDHEAEAPSPPPPLRGPDKNTLLIATNMDVAVPAMYMMATIAVRATWGFPRRQQTASFQGGTKENKMPSDVRPTVRARADWFAFRLILSRGTPTIAPVV